MTVLDLSDAKSVKKAQREAALRLAQQRLVLVEIMSSPTGRTWVYDLLAACGIGQTPFATDPYCTAFNCGQQNIGLRLMSEFQSAAPHEYIQMMKENSPDARSLDAGPGPGPDGPDDAEGA